jgi:DNA-binding LytR/AlgR family response regulator
MKKILIVEDEKELAQNLKELIEALGYEVPGVFDRGTLILEYLKKCPADLILMDVMIIGELDGIQLTKEIKALYDIPVIFTTAFSDQGVLERISHIPYEGYLLKPFSMQALKSGIFLALNKLGGSEKNLEKQNKQSIKIRDKGYLVPVPYSDVLFLEAYGLYSKIITKSKTYVLRGILKDITKDLPDKQFIRVHKSFTINLDKIQSLNGKEIVMQDDYVIPLRRGFYKQLLELINK